LQNPQFPFPTNGGSSRSPLADQQMSEEVILTIVLLVLALPIGLSVMVGFNRTAKIGLLLVVVGVACISYSQYVLHENAAYELVTKNFGTKTGFNRIYLSVWGVGIGIAICGGCALFVGSVIRVWKKRLDILPFLFK
jgi:hypothetical protein